MKKTIAAIIVMATAQMQVAMAMTADTSRVVDLDEVVVVAQPKEQVRLRLQPVASNVFTDKLIKQADITSLSSLASFIPSLAVPNYGARSTSSIYLRGIGSRSGEPSVGLYCDNIPIVSKSAYNRYLYQMDRADVLRGPQATLYGINSEAGLLRLFTRSPMTYQGTDLRVGFATAKAGRMELAHYSRQNDKFAFSVAAFYSGQGGFFDNANLGGKTDLSNETGVRFRMIWKTSSRLSFDFSSDYQYVNQNAFAYGEYNETTDKFNDPSTTFMNGYRRQSVITGLTVAYTAPSLVLCSTTSHQYLYDLMLMDQDYLPQDFLRLEQRQRMNAFTQELSLRNRGAVAWRHATGLFFSRQWLHTTAPVTFGDDMNSMIVSNMGMPAYIAQGISISDNAVPGTFDTPQLDLAIYHESSINLFPCLTFTIGLRYDHQHVSIDYDTNAHFLLAYDVAMQGHSVEGESRYLSTFAGSAKEDYNQLLPKMALTYEIGCGNIYATVSKGFRAGGYNLQMFSDIFKTEQSSLGQGLMQMMKGDFVVEHSADDYDNVNNTITYKPETSWNYEAGTHLNLFANKMQADISLFYMQVHDQQLSLMAGNYGYGRMMVNAGRTDSYGMETSIRGLCVGGRLSWSATYGYTHSTFRDYTDGKNDYSGNSVPFVPRHTFSVMGAYRFDMSPHTLVRSITVGANASGNGSLYWDTANLHSQNFYAKLGAYIALDAGRMKFRFWGNDITNTRCNTFLVDSSIDGTSRLFAQRANPLQFGLDISLHW